MVSTLATTRARLRAAAGGLSTLLVAMLVPIVAPGAVLSATAALAQPAVVSAVPAAFTPNVLSGAVQKMVRIGNTMYLGGTFTSVQDVTNNVTYPRTNLVAFDMTTGVVSTTFAPAVSGGEVSGLATDGTSVFATGAFTLVNGVTTRVAKLDPITGAMVAGWLPAALDGRGRDLTYTGGRIFVTGDFTRVGGIAQPALATLRASDGGRDAFGGGVIFQGPFTSGVVNVRKMSINPAGTRMLVIGNFNAISGQTRPQIAMLDLTGAALGLSTWATTAYGQQNNCAVSFDTWMRNIDWSPDGTWFAVVTTGAWGGGTSTCDSAARFEFNENGTNVPTWVTQTGGDSLFSVAITGTAVYIGGHLRWVNNPLAPNRAGPGAVSRIGLAALDPRNGMPLPWNPTRDRGVGVFDMMATDVGLWIAHDTNIVAHLTRERVAFFPLAGGQTLPPDVTGAVPTSAYLLGRTANINTNVLHRVNVAGPQVASTDSGSVWLADNGASNPFRSDGSLVSLNTVTTPLVQAPNPYAPPATTPNAVYQSQRYNVAPAGPMVWTFPVTAGTDVSVRLYLADRTSTAVGKRVFNVNVNAVPVTVTYPGNSAPSADLDLFKLLGRYNGGMITSPVVTSTGTITIAFSPKASNPVINGIEVVTNGGAVPAQDTSNDARFAALSGATSQLPQAAPAGGIAWGQARGAVQIDANVFYGMADGTWHSRTFDGTTWGADSVIPQNFDPISNASQWANELPLVQAMFWEQGRLYYTLSGSTNLWYRSMSPITGFLSAQRQVAQTNILGIDWSTVTGAFPGGDGFLYAAKTDGSLSRLTWTAGTVTARGQASGTPVVVSGPALDGASWAARALFIRSNTTLPVAPTVSLNAPVCSGKACAFSGVATGRAPFTFQWNFGDRTYVTTTVTGANNGTATGTAVHTFAVAGTYQVRLTVIDAAGQVTSTSTPVSVVNTAPTASYTFSCTGRSCAFTGIGSDDGPGALAYTWDFGDGTFGTGATPTHIYAANGTYSTVFTVTDTEGLMGTASQAVSVVNAPPTAQIVSVQCAALSCTANGTGTDPEGGAVTYSWDIGTGDPALTGTPASWTYALPGTYTLTLSVTDDVGATTTVAVSVKVSSQLVAFRDQAKVQGNTSALNVTVPASVQVGDGLLMYVSTNVSNDALTTPAGWTQLGERIDGNLRTRLLSKVATGTDAGSKIPVTTGSVQRIDVSLLAYSGTDTTNPVAAWQSQNETVAQASHTTPVVTVPGLPGQPGVAGGPLDGGLVVSYWADRTAATTGWTIPATLNQRGPVIAPLVSGRVTAVSADDTTPVAAGGSVGGQIATATTSTGTSATSQATMWTVVLQRG